MMYDVKMVVDDPIFVEAVTMMTSMNYETFENRIYSVASQVVDKHCLEDDFEIDKTIDRPRLLF